MFKDYHHLTMILKHTYASGFNPEYQSYNTTLLYFSFVRAKIGLQHFFEFKYNYGSNPARFAHDITAIITLASLESS